MNPIESVIEAVGGRANASNICCVSRVTIHKWIKNGSLPRTEYTGKTQYAEKLANNSRGKFTKDWLLEAANPDRLIAANNSLCGQLNHVSEPKHTDA